MKNGFIMIPDSSFEEKMPDKARILLGIITRYSKKRDMHSHQIKYMQTN